MKILNRGFWEEIIQLTATHSIVIDRPKGQPHPCYREMIYPLDYGYIENTSASDGGGIDVWIGSLELKTLTGILCTFDTLKNDAEIKILLGCTSQEVETIIDFHGQAMKMLYIQKPED
ncbi:MAG: inorganic pyrophosphatase [Anaerolineales bacterium]|nr:inorganic pyrophosphatase [Anaerolineales bacterium]